MLTTTTEEHLTITSVVREVLALNGSGEIAAWRWIVDAANPNGVEFRFRLDSSEVAEPGGEVIIHWRAQIVNQQ